MNTAVIAIPAHNMKRDVPRAAPIGPKARRTPGGMRERVAGGGVLGRAHQYRILGSMYALTKSMITLTTTTTSANTMMIPCTAA